MHAGNLVAPAVSRVAPLSRATNRGAPAAGRDRRRRLLEVLAGPVNTSPFPLPTTHRPTRSIDRSRLAG